MTAERYIGSSQWTRCRNGDALACIGMCSVWISGGAATLLNKVSDCFAQSLRTISGIVPIIGHDRFLPIPLLIIVYLSSYHWHCEVWLLRVSVDRSLYSSGETWGLYSDQIASCVRMIKKIENMSFILGELILAKETSKISLQSLQSLSFSYFDYNSIGVSHLLHQKTAHLILI
jgi:hypothetical protein